MTGPTLGTCKCCGGTVSSEARACPHCGQPYPSTDGLEREVLLLLSQGKKIHAIKAVREATGVGLAEAKNLVESLEFRS